MPIDVRWCAGLCACVVVLTRAADQLFAAAAAAERNARRRRLDALCIAHFSRKPTRPDDAPMRAEGKQRDVDAAAFVNDVLLLVCESRCNGRDDGAALHCPRVNVSPSVKPHVCTKGDVSCERAALISSSVRRSFAESLALRVTVRLLPSFCERRDSVAPSANDSDSHGILLETWSIDVLDKPAVGEAVVPQSMFLQAVRSRLGYSQLSAWLQADVNASYTFTTQYSICLAPIDRDTSRTSAFDAYEHDVFPSCRLGERQFLRVAVRYLRRQDEFPSIGCPCGADAVSSTAQATTSRPPTVEVQGVTAEAATEFIDACGESPLTPAEWICGESSAAPIVLVPVALPPPPSAATAPQPSAANPLFEPLAQEEWSRSLERRLRERFDGLRVCSPERSGVTFYLDEACTSSSLTPLREGRKRVSQTILFSDAAVLPLHEDESADSGYHSGLFALDAGEWAMKKSRLDSAPSSVSVGGAHCSPPLLKLEAAFTSPDAVCRSRNRWRNPSDRLRFSVSGLPITSSPAPIKRNQHSFDFDSDLTTISGLRSAVYRDADSGSSDSESGAPLCKSAPASTHLLGNFEECALNRRIKPHGSLDGFFVDLAASGSFCPPHVRLPVATCFFDVSDDSAPSPFLGECSLELLGKKGYLLPKKGTVQVTLFNPQGTVVKMFVVRFDLSDMPTGCQTFVRQRTFFMPAVATLADARRNPAWLRYLIHLRFTTTRSGKLYLHTDLRMLFSRKSELDAYNVGACDSSTAAADATYELRSFTEMPRNPKFSPRKAGRPVAAQPATLPLSHLDK